MRLFANIRPDAEFAKSKSFVLRIMINQFLLCLHERYDYGKIILPIPGEKLPKDANLAVL